MKWWQAIRRDLFMAATLSGMFSDPRIQPTDGEIFRAVATCWKVADEAVRQDNAKETK